jgi:deoxycytidylate deaminase
MRQYNQNRRLMAKRRKEKRLFDHVVPCYNCISLPMCRQCRSIVCDKLYRKVLKTRHSSVRLVLPNTGVIKTSRTSQSRVVLPYVLNTSIYIEYMFK